MQSSTIRITGHTEHTEYRKDTQQHHLNNAEQKHRNYIGRTIQRRRFREGCSTRLAGPDCGTADRSDRTDL
jgi:hypothetical protein